MTTKSIQEIYYDILKSGMFWEKYPQLSGIWLADEKEFTKIMTTQQSEFSKRTVEQMKSEKSEMETTIDDMVKAFMLKYGVKELTFDAGYKEVLSNSGELLTIEGRTEIEVSY